MARGASQNDYGSFGSVPDSVPLQGSGARPLSVQANPADFGAQVGAGVQKVGEAAEGLAKQYGDMVNETLMTKADADFTTKLGQLKADYTSKTGMAAFNSFPAYQEAVKQAFQESRANLPMGAQHGFDMLGARTMGNHIADGSTYATSQLKEAQRSSGAEMTNANMQAIAQIPPDGLVDSTRTDEHIGHALYGVQMQMDENHPGLKKNANGEITFDESTPEGQGLKAQYEAQKNDIITRAQTTRFDTLAKNDVLGAYGLYLNERSSLPKQTQITLDAHFEPMVFNAHKDNAVGHAIAQSQDDYAKVLYNPSNTGSNAYNLGNVKTAEGAKNNTQEFVNPATPVDGTILTANNLRTKNYEGKTLEQIGNTWTSTDKSAWIKNVSAVSGVSSNTVPDLNDPVILGKILKGISVAEGKDKSIFTDDVIQQGVTASLAGHQPMTTQQPPKSYATNPDGSMLTPADYYRTHSADVIAKGDAYAEVTMPGDLAFQRVVRENLTNYMNKVKADQAGQYIMDNKNVMRGITGELTKGNPPATEQELRAIPGMNDLLNRVSAQDPKFSETIPRKIAEAQRQNITTNSPNMYPSLLRTLEPHGAEYPNAISSDDHLDRLVGQLDGSGINMKDRNDLHPAVELPPETKAALLQKVKDISAANGNIDGKGEQRSVQWYNQAMTAIKKNDALGDGKESDLDKILPPAPMPSRIGQLSDLAAARAKEKMVPTFASPDNPDFAKLPSGSQFQDANGKMWTKK